MYVELHKKLFDEEEYTKEGARYFAGAWARALPDEKRPGSFRFSPEDEYIYELAHFHKHYLNQGSGIRSVLDIAIYRSRFAGQLDEEYIAAELKKLHMTAFARAAEELARCWFGTPAQRTAAKSRDAKNLEEVVFYSGVDGSHISVVVRDIQQVDTFGGRARYFWGRIFLPLKELAREYALLEKYPILYPYFTLRRFLRLAIHERGRVLAEIDVICGKKTLK